MNVRIVGARRIDLGGVDPLHILDIGGLVGGIVPRRETPAMIDLGTREGTALGVINNLRSARSSSGISSMLKSSIRRLYIARQLLLGVRRARLMHPGPM